MGLVIVVKMGRGRGVEAYLHEREVHQEEEIYDLLLESFYLAEVILSRLDMLNMVILHRPT